MSAQDDAFRARLRAWLEKHPPPALHLATTAEHVAVLREWHRTMHEGGWIGAHWPVEYGGLGASPAQVAIYNQELSRAQAPHLLARGGLSLVGPTLMTHGTSEQRARWMPRILEGDDVWCQLFSEPDAGSDLASLTTRAERHDNIYVVNGQKVWSSYAQFANWAIALVRTDADAPRHKGISMLAIPMTAKGIEIRPLRQITGESEFNEVFLDNVEVPVENRIGPEHEGWRVTTTTLGNERGGSFVWKEQVLQESAMARLIEACTARGGLRDPLLRQRIAQTWIELALFRMHNARTLERLASGDEIGPLSSVVKLFWAGMSQRLAETAVAALAPDVPEEWTLALLATRANSIMGGTSEIQRNIIGERLLGLAREAR